MDKNSESMDDVWRKLRDATWRRKFDIAEALLKKYPELKSLGTKQMKETVLHFLAIENDLEGVEWLYKHGFDINTRNSFGTPVVFEVALLGYQELLLWFVRRGASPEGLDYSGNKQNILDYLADFEEQGMIEFVKNNWPNVSTKISEGAT